MRAAVLGAYLSMCRVVVVSSERRRRVGGSAVEFSCDLNKLRFKTGLHPELGDDHREFAAGDEQCPGPSPT